MREPLLLRADMLELDIDLRIGLTMIDVLRTDGGNEQFLASVLRLVYGSGYADGLIDVPRGKLFRDHGFAVPKRQSTKP